MGNNKKRQTECFGERTPILLSQAQLPYRLLFSPFKAAIGKLVVMFGPPSIIHLGIQNTEQNKYDTFRHQIRARPGEKKLGREEEEGEGERGRGRGEREGEEEGSHQPIYWWIFYFPFLKKKKKRQIKFQHKCIKYRF